MSTNEEKVKELGWLSEDGICDFPPEVKACTLGFVAPTLPITFFVKATPEQLQQAIDKGWIKFVDGAGTKLTFAEYIATYPDYPDPVFQLTLRGTFPPQVKRFRVLGMSR